MRRWRREERSWMVPPAVRFLHPTVQRYLARGDDLRSRRDSSDREDEPAV